MFLVLTRGRLALKAQLTLRSLSLSLEAVVPGPAGAPSRATLALLHSPSRLASALGQATYRDRQESYLLFPFFESLPLFVERKICAPSSCQELCYVSFRSKAQAILYLHEVVNLFRALNPIQDILPCSTFAVCVSPLIRPINESSSNA